ncbi:MAG: type II and III secretion system protein family protein [Hyphomicrobium sp.]
MFSLSALAPVEAAGRKVEAGPIGAAVAYDDRFSGSIGRAAVVVKKSQVVHLDHPYATALIAETEIADVVPLSDRAIYVLGKKIGATRLTVVGEDQKILKIVEVDVTPDVDDLSAKLAENLPEAEIRVSAVNGGLMLSGVVLAAPDVERAVAIARQYAPPELVTNALSVASPQQVMLEVRFVEAARSAARELGVSTRARSSSVAADTGGQYLDPGIGPLQTAALLSGSAPFGSMLARILEGGTNVDVLLRGLEERSLARRLAEPNLVTTSGDTASFLAGGEFPFPVSAADNRITIEFKQFGIGLAFTPTVLSGGLINLKIAPEVSDIDQTNSVALNGVRIPGLVVRRANTSVELRDGQSLAIAGLLQHQHAKNQEQLPWIGSVPVLGALFRSAEYQKQESDLVIIVTPRLVKPKRPGERLDTPLDGPVASNDVDFFIDGRSEIPRTGDRRREPDRAMIGHIIHIGPEAVANAATK